MSTTACRRDARDPGMQARRPRSWDADETIAIHECRRDDCESSMFF
ncbi:MAG: hypothetical protein LBP59_00510 [Planctomycetaceae bacterium]|nr:hypothetical protein [Planctomycetaceae bacterium]